MGMFNLFMQEIAIDLGTANTIIYYNDKVVVDEPSIVAKDRQTGKTVAIGRLAQQMHGKTHKNIETIRPLKDGVIADFDLCEQMLREFIRQVHTSRFSKPRMIVCVPSEITGVERRAVQDAAEFAGARRPVYVIEEPMAAAIGAGLPVHLPSANLIVDIGGGTTEVAVISMGGIVTAHSARVAGDDLNEAIVELFHKEFALDIGENTAESVKIQIGSAWPLAEELSADVGGRDAATGLPRTQLVTSEEVREALDGPVTMIVDAIKTTLERTPPELAADIIGHGLVLSGGGALLTGLAERVTNETGIHSYLAPEPLESVVLGCGLTLDNIDAMKGLTAQTSFE